MGSKHIPVLTEEVMNLLECGPQKTYVDATLGGGGHALEILQRSSPDGVVIGIDWDEEAISEAKERLEPFGERVKIFRENFIRLPDVMKTLKLSEVDGILLDLGLSSLQLEDKERGFSFKGEGRLDMRMDQRIERTAADLINGLCTRDLESILREFGEERWAKRIAKAVAIEREKKPIETTLQLKRIVHQAIPRRFHSRKIDPATRTFQAFRIHVNRELDHLKELLETGWTFLKRGGRMCVISFHSLEDRIVKETFRTLDRRGVMREITRKPIIPSEEERRRNPRSRSAKLRCAERI